MGRNCFKAVLYGLKGYLRRSRSVCTASYKCIRRLSREHGNRVEAVLPPSTLRPARVRRKAENTLHTGRVIKKPLPSLTLGKATVFFGLYTIIHPAGLAGES